MMRRAALVVIKFLIYGLSLVLLYVFLFAGLLKITVWISECCWLHKLVGVVICSQIDMTAYVIAAATLEFAVLTMMQQHITRQQDRALDFPDLCIERCELIIEPEKVMDDVFGRDTVEGKYIVKMFFGKSFPVYYKPRIYKAWVRQRKCLSGDGELHKIIIRSSYFDKNHEYAVWGMQIDKQDCVYQTAARNQIKKVQYLEFVYNVSWENQLLPWINRKLSKLYMKLVISLEDIGERNVQGCSIKVRKLEIKK